MNKFASFFNSENGDRVYDSDVMRSYLRKFFTNGVFDGAFEVSNRGGMIIDITPGYAHINGAVVYYPSSTSYTLDIADGLMDRVDAIVIEYNENDRTISMKIVKGSYDISGDVEFEPVRSDGVYQIVLATILVRAASTDILYSDITDTRPDEHLCGYIHGTVDNVDFSQITANFADYFADTKASNLDEFNEWYENEYSGSSLTQDEIDNFNKQINTYSNDVSSSERVITESESRLDEIVDYIPGLIADKKVTIKQFSVKETWLEGSGSGDLVNRLTEIVLTPDEFSRLKCISIILQADPMDANVSVKYKYIATNAVWDSSINKYVGEIQAFKYAQSDSVGNEVYKERCGNCYVEFGKDSSGNYYISYIDYYALGIEIDNSKNTPGSTKFKHTTSWCAKPTDDYKPQIKSLMFFISNE